MNFLVPRNSDFSEKAWFYGTFSCPYGVPIGPPYWGGPPGTDTMLASGLAWLAWVAGFGLDLAWLWFGLGLDLA